jgi:pseudolysin
MSLSIVAKSLFLGLPFIYSSQTFAAKSDLLTNKSHSNLKSLMPSSDQQLRSLSRGKFEREENSITPTSLSRTFLQTEINYGGGYGGNERTGMLHYDGLPDHPSALMIKRDAKTKTCYLENQSAGVFHFNFWGYLKPVSYECATTDQNHNDVYWNDKQDKTNGGYSPDNDVLYAGSMINAMYLEWFGIPAIQNADGSPASVKIAPHVHSMANNGYADLAINLIGLGDGDKNYYPGTSPGIVAYLMGFLFTNQHSKLQYSGHSGAIDHAFGAMSDQAIKFYIHGKNDWQIGSEISKSGHPMYFLDRPSKDCGSRVPGDNCSIDHMSQYNDKIDLPFRSGIYRRALYLLGTTPDWDVKKVFSIMVQANRFYWTNNINFEQGMCGLIKAARDYQYDETAIINAFSQVGVMAQNC